MLIRFCTQRVEVGVRIRNVANIQELLAKLKAAIAQLFRKMFSRPLDFVTNNARRQLSLFQWKCSFWSKMLTLTQQASAAGLDPEDKQTAMKFMCSQLQLLLCGQSRLLDEIKVSRIASHNRLCCFIPPSVLPVPLLDYLRGQ
jgi:paraquat-inducible protein B